MKRLLPFLICCIFVPAAAAQEAPASLQPAIDNRPMLWQDLRYGMTADEAAILLRALPGIRAAAVKPSKKKPPRIVMDYTKEGVTLLGLRNEIGLTFGSSGLEQVDLRSAACLALSMEKFKGLRDLISQKYGAARTQKEVNEARDLTGIRDFCNSSYPRASSR
ncbi:hypothetical protein [Sphingomonas sp.]|uniref:hypothetical protein n=1 Tax=Sphingomonas sp. TaxID=28214 RepID=UPI002ED9B32E